MACVLFGNNVTKPFIGRSKTSQIFKSYAFNHSLKLRVRETPKPRKVKEDKIFLKLYWNKEKNKFIFFTGKIISLGLVWRSKL